MRKYALFLVIFIFAFIGLQILSGMLLTMFYTPDSPWEAAAALASEVEFGTVSFVPPLAIALAALGSAFGITKLIGKKAV